MVGFCCADDGTECGVGFGTPLAAEPVGDLAKDRAGTQVTFGHVVGVRHAAVGDEHEKVATVGGDALAVGLIFAARMLPSLLFGLAAGTIADRAPTSAKSPAKAAANAAR